MQSAIFPQCCGLNILHGFPASEVGYSEAFLTSQCETVEKTIKEYETGKLARGYCGEQGNSPYLRAHVIAITSRQARIKASLEKTGYKELGSFPGPHIYGAVEGDTGFYRIYLMGKGFDAPGKETK